MYEDLISATPYDDVFRTLLNDCSRLALPLINEMFGENYTGNEKIYFSPNEHYLNQQDGKESKRVTDTCLTIVGKDLKQYHLECESSADLSVLIRIFEYDAQIALDQNGKLVGNRIIVRFPNTGVLFLRSTQATPDELEVVIQTPGGVVTYPVPCVKVLSYSIEEIFEKRLFFLIPFFAFTYEKRFQKIEKSEDLLGKMKAEYKQIREKLEQLCSERVIDSFTMKTLMDMTQRVLVNLAQKHQKIVEGVGSVMVGKVLDYEAKRIYNQGRKEGEEVGWRKGEKEGWKKGQKQGQMKTLMAMVQTNRLTLQEAAEMAGVTEKVFREQVRDLFEK